MSAREAMARLTEWVERDEGFRSLTLSHEPETGFLLTLSVSEGPFSVDLAHVEGTRLERVIDEALADASQRAPLLREPR